MDLELATPQNFDEEGYLLANPDVARHVAAGGNALAHFEEHGLCEGRRQAIVNRERRHIRRRQRYDRFVHLLSATAGAGGEFNYLEQPETFPVRYGCTLYDLEEYQAESANAGFGPFIDEIRANPQKLYLDVGCGKRTRVEPNCLYLEVYRSQSADIVMEPACRYPIASESLDGIGCFAVLEHVERPWEAALEFRRMLKPGGKVFIDWPFLQPVHGFPNHYYNATREGLRQMFADGFTVEQLDTFPNQTPDHTVNWLLQDLTQSMAPAARERLLSMSVEALLRETPGSPFWEEVLASLSPKAIETLACGNTLIATRR
ncbi:class I SAM-dependent methyltransferase [Sphingomonas crusticola]|uniref:class I SAM-dependent methyltransferase n=1 Tax=Sphingomonas crusticola TaxID=1697973 RepID=UPI001F07A326|nr:methyltransferase domain-containing protein [Sphingomonas crusticola]